MSRHRQVTYLNEPRNLWASAFPETDIWTTKASSRNGKLVFSAADAGQKKGEIIRRLFRFETIKSGKPVLIEKLPINTFRLNFIYQLFPDARFIHIYRNGLEVARSIEKCCEKEAWFGSHSFKWNLLVEYALSGDDTKHLPALCSTYFDKGLLEWRLSTEAAVQFFRRLGPNVFFELNYDELLKNPVKTLSQLLEFLDLEEDSEVQKFASENLFRKSREIGQRQLSEKEQIIGGALLPLSIDRENGLTNGFDERGGKAIPPTHL